MESPPPIITGVHRRLNYPVFGTLAARRSRGNRISVQWNVIRPFASLTSFLEPYWATPRLVGSRIEVANRISMVNFITWPVQITPVSTHEMTCFVLSSLFSSLQLPSSEYPRKMIRVNIKTSILATSNRHPTAHVIWCTITYPNSDLRRWQSLYRPSHSLSKVPCWILDKS